MIEVNNLYKTLGKHEILKGINAKINKGEKVVILGSSGCGKSTFLRCINLLERPSKGQIIINGTDITDKNNININKVRQKIGMVFQNFNLFPHLTILHNITLAPTSLKIKSHNEAKKQALELLKRIGLADKANMYPHQLSGGQKQRVAIIRSLAREPEIMLLDEPTSALDPTMVGEVFALIKELALSGMTMLIVTHSLNFAKEIANKIFFMSDGLIVENNSSKNFFNNPETKQAKDFLNSIY